MLWRLLRRLARLYSLACLVIIGFTIAVDGFSQRLLTEYEMTLALFFPYGVLVGLLLSWVFMTLGSVITALALIGFYLVQYNDTGVFSDNIWPPIIAGPALLFFFAGQLKSISSMQRQRKKS